MTASSRRIRLERTKEDLLATLGRAHSRGARGRCGRHPLDRRWRPRPRERPADRPRSARGATRATGPRAARLAPLPGRATLRTGARAAGARDVATAAATALAHVARARAHTAAAGPCAARRR